MTKFNRPTAIQTTLGDLAGSLSEISRTAGYRKPSDWLYASRPLETLEGSTPVDDGEPSPHPDLVPDRWKAIDDGHFDEMEPEEDDE